MAEQKQRQASAEAKAKDAANAAAATPGDQPVPAPEPEPKPEDLAGDELKERARELDIEGRSEMKADELREAIAEAERKQKAPDSIEEKREGATHDTRSFSKQRFLQDGPTLLGYPLHEVALGLYDLDDDEELSVADAQARVQEALDRPLED